MYMQLAQVADGNSGLLNPSVLFGTPLMGKASAHRIYRFQDRSSPLKSISHAASMAICQNRCSILRIARVASLMDASSFCTSR
jgi:hypothetical protein